MNNTGLILIMIALVLLLVGSVFLTLRFVKNAKKKAVGDVENFEHEPGEILFVGIRSSTKTPYLRWGRPSHGVFVWEEKDYQADIHVEGFVSHGPQGAVCLVDLDRMHPIRYEGTCEDDEAETEVTLKLEDGTVVNNKIRSLWKSLTGEQLNRIRRDTRLRQLNEIGSSIWEILLRMTPIFMIGIGFLLLAVLGIVIFLVVKAG